MMREDVENILKDQKDYLNQKYFVRKIGIFGSYSHDERKETSDIDILVEFTRR